MTIKQPGIERTKPGRTHGKAVIPEKHENLELGEALYLVQHGTSRLGSHHVHQLQQVAGNRAVLQAMEMDAPRFASALIPTPAVLQCKGDAKRQKNAIAAKKRRKAALEKLKLKKKLIAEKRKEEAARMISSEMMKQKKKNLTPQEMGKKRKELVDMLPRDLKEKFDEKTD